MKLALLMLATALVHAADKPMYEAEFIFEPEKWHNHSSSIVELANGDLFVCWFHGSGERTADDVVVQIARKRRNAKQWEQRFQLADTPGFPDTNPTLFVDSKQRLWLFWQAIVANEWHTALTRYRISAPDTPLKPDVSEVMILKPRNFAEKVETEVQRLTAGLPDDSLAAKWGKRALERARDKYFSRMGWMNRNHPLELPSGRILVPMYSDGYSFSLIAITDDGGKTWSTSEPLVGGGSIQPSLARRKDGSIVAFMRDNGPPPKRIHMSESKDDGVTWSSVVDTEFPNPGASCQLKSLPNGLWALVYNDLERGRHSLNLMLSNDEGKTWKWKRHLERTEGGSFHYPSLIQTRDGMIHVTYSHFLSNLKTIKHAAFNVAWVQQGDPVQN